MFTRVSWEHWCCSDMLVYCRVSHLHWDHRQFGGSLQEGWGYARSLVYCRVSGDLGLGLLQWGCLGTQHAGFALSPAPTLLGLLLQALPELSGAGSTFDYFL